ncbi:unnamed protein product [Enterobius vermicularis]|uniref:SET domain-containing protein n=1 Tax=Enterobius vermicularis TaxID=51028 RepID=A0A0N4V3W2_ENTVE|nr:unnamed protein product [Enterobius vermicularis]
METVEFRQLVCDSTNRTAKADKTSCYLVVKDTEDEEPGRNAPVGDGCFTEFHGKEERIYCDLACPEAHTVFHSKSISNKVCFKFYTYQIERRGNDWYMWRSGKCLSSPQIFDFGCKFDRPFKEQFADDAAVFRSLRARKA